GTGAERSSAVDLALVHSLPAPGDGPERRDLLLPAGHLDGFSARRGCGGSDHQLVWQVTTGACRGPDPPERGPAAVPRQPACWLQRAHQAERLTPGVPGGHRPELLVRQRTGECVKRGHSYV